MKVTDLELFLDVDFSNTILKGKVYLKCEKQKNVVTTHLVRKLGKLFI